MSGVVLVLNSGSTSLKAGVFAAGQGSGLASVRAVLTAEADHLGQPESLLRVRDSQGRPMVERQQPLHTQQEALSALAAVLGEHSVDVPAAVGHRIVHGGPRLLKHTALTPPVLDTLRRSVHFAPLHLPSALRLVEAAEQAFPGVPQYACFDTAFHSTMPEEATRLAIPASYAAAGVRRYGFHGLSYESIVAQLGARPEPLPARIVCAHLGGGSSLCAIYRGRSVDTTMGLSPTGGIPMATRTGDLDPEVVVFLARSGIASLDALERLINQQSGLSAICGTGDMQAIQAAKDAGRADAALAFSIFTTAVAKAIAGLIVSLGGLDLLVFTGGIGEHSAAVRASVLTQLAPFGIRVDEVANQQSAANIAASSSKVPIAILPAEEDAMIAVHTQGMMAGG